MRKAYPRCHLDSRRWTCACMDTNISPTTDVCRHVAEYWEKKASLLTAPSAVHLQDGFRSGSQLPGLSVRSYHALSPLQRFFDGNSISQCTIFVNKFPDFFMINDQYLSHQDSICLPRKLAAVCTSLISVSVAGSSYFPSVLPMEATHPTTSPSVKIGIAQET